MVIAAYNAERFLADALSSVAAQTALPLETIVVDDGSTDRTAEIARRHPLKVRLIQQENAGSAAARNRGVAEARGTHVAFLDADDLWLPENLARQTAALARTDARWAYTNAWFVDATASRRLAQWSDTHPAPEGDVAVALLRRNFIALPTLIAERSAVRAVGGFPERRPSSSEDWALALRLALGHPAAYVPEPSACIREHEARKTATMDLDAALADRLLTISDAVAQAPARLGRAAPAALAGVHCGIARKWLVRGETGRARAVLWRGLREDPTHVPSLTFWPVTWLPTQLRKGLGRIRAVYRARRLPP